MLDQADQPCHADEDLSTNGKITREECHGKWWLGITYVVRLRPIATQQFPVGAGEEGGQSAVTESELAASGVSNPQPFAQFRAAKHETDLEDIGLVLRMSLPWQRCVGICLLLPGRCNVT